MSRQDRFYQALREADRICSDRPYKRNPAKRLQRVHECIERMAHILRIEVTERKVGTLEGQKNI